MSDLQRLLRQADQVPTPDLWRDIEAWEPRPVESSLGRRLAVLAVALPLAASGIVLAATAFFGDREEPSPRTSAVDLDPRITAEIPVGQFPQEIAVGEGAVWVTVNDANPPERWFVARIDPGTNEVTNEIEVFEAHDVAVGSGTVWVTGRDRELGPALFRLDPLGGEVAATIPLHCGRCHPDQVVATEAAVWLTASTAFPDSGQVIGVDPVTNEIVWRTTVPGDPRDLVAGEGGVWVYSLTHFTKQSVAGGTIYRLDPVTGEVVATLLEGRVPPASGVNGPPVLVAGHGFVWTSIAPGRPIVLGSDRTGIVRIDPATNEIVGQPLSLGTLFFPFSVEGGGVWFRRGSEAAEPLISRIDPATLRVQDLLALEDTVLDGAVDPATGSMWLTTYQDSVIRVDLG
jgi:hypothetical protein